MKPPEFRAGVIEGFFGRPWGWPARQSSIAFGLGLTPFEIYRNYDDDAKTNLRSKLSQINEIGPEILCILFDDMDGSIDRLGEQQARVISDVCSWSSAGHFIVCPTYYSDDPVLAKLFGVTPQSYLHDLGRLVDPLIDIFWTGEKVISDRYSEVHLADVAHRIGRKPFIWDNHIANDSRIRSNFLFLDPSAGGWELPADRAAGLAVNPMNQPCLSRIALMGYQSLLCANRNDLLPNVCRLLCGSSFAQLLLEDAHVLQNVGFAGLDSKEFARLLDRYSSRGTDPYAREIASWLSGEYAFDPQCLTE